MPVKKKVKKQIVKQKQKVNTKVSQNVKVIIGNVRKRKGSSNPSNKSQQQKQGHSVSLNIINPYQQMLAPPPPPVPPQTPPVKNTVSYVPPNPPPPNSNGPSMIRELAGKLESQSSMIRQKTQDLKEFQERQKAIFDSILATHRQKETPQNVVIPDKTSKIEKMLKTKKMIMSSVNWENIIKDEPKAEKKLTKEQSTQSNIYQFLSPRPVAPAMPEASQRDVNSSIASSWLKQARENLLARREVESVQPAVSQQAFMNAFQQDDDESQSDGPYLQALFGDPADEINSFDVPPSQAEQAVQTSDFEEALDNSGGAGAEKSKRGRKPGPMSALETPQKGESYQETYDKLRQYSEEELRKKHLKGKKLYQYAEQLGVATKDPVTKKMIKVEDIREVILDLLNINTKYHRRKDDIGQTPIVPSPAPPQPKSSKKKRKRKNRKLVMEDDEN